MKLRDSAIMSFGNPDKGKFIQFGLWDCQGRLPEKETPNLNKKE